MQHVTQISCVYCYTFPSNSSSRMSSHHVIRPASEKGRLHVQLQFQHVQLTAIVGTSSMLAEVSGPNPDVCWASVPRLCREYSSIRHQLTALAAGSHLTAIACGLLLSVCVSPLVPGAVCLGASSRAVRFECLQSIMPTLAVNQ